MSPFSYKSPEWLAARRLALARAHYRCEFCNAPVSGRKASRVDHIVPVRENPALALAVDNLRVLCIRCDAARHAEKGNRTVPRLTIGVDGFPE